MPAFAPRVADARRRGELGAEDRTSGFDQALRMDIACCRLGSAIRTATARRAAEARAKAL